ncbi:hypothetical protein P59_066 [Bacillus phage P59]|nr:hypothetical protein P59_066 [Bacillus phage P59]
MKDHNIYRKGVDENGKEVTVKAEIQQFPANFKRLQDSCKKAVAQNGGAMERLARSDYEQTYEDFWKDIVEEDGQVNMDQIKRELADYRVLLQEVPKVYDELAGFSKPHTRATVIIDAVNERMIDKQMAFDDLTALAEDGEVTLTVAELKKYFDIGEDY